MRTLIVLLFLAAMAACATNPVSRMQPLETPADTGSAEPYLFTDAAGKVYLSWIAKDSTGSALKFSTLTGDKWGSPKLIASGKDWFVNWADYPVIAAGDSNHLIAHFLQKSDSGKFTYDIKYTLSSDGGNTWTAPVVLHNDSIKAEHGFVSIIPYGDNYFASWLDGRNAASTGHHHEGHHGQMTLRGAIIDRSGKKLQEWELDDRVCDCCQTSAAITANGPVVVYRDRSAEEIRDISIVRLVNGVWTKPVPVHADGWKIEGCPVNGPRIAALGNKLAVSWFTAADKNAAVFLAFSADGGASFSIPAKMHDAKPTGRVDVAVLDTSSAMVSWMEGTNIKSVRAYADGTKDSSFVIASTSASRASGFPHMARWGDRLLFAWTNDSVKQVQIAATAATAN